MAQKPSIPKGTRDFSPAEVSKRNYIISIMRNHFEKFGYQPIETPSFENSETLMGKYGEEGDRLIFKILNSGDYLKDVDIIEDEFKEVMKVLLSNQFLIFYYENCSNLSLIEIEEMVNNTSLLSDIFIGPIVWDKKYSDVLNLDEDTPRGSEIYRLIGTFKKTLIRWITKSINNPESLLANAIDFSVMVIKTVYNDHIGTRKLGISYQKLTSSISEKALRYDLTVPFARYVVQHQSEIEFPFKRYQIQPVWRADRPQKGRFREFYQCDADVVGSKSLWQEVELVQLYDSVFAELGLKGVTIKINNRKILSGIAEVIGASDKLIDFTVALDKLDKIGEEGVKKEMIEKGISEEALEKVQPLFHFTGSIQDKLEKLSVLLDASEEGKKGIEELHFICEKVMNLGLKQANLDLDVTLARGLNYYTGAIFEVTAPEGVAMGSIGGGGRYDDLTGIFGLKNMSGVGISFGLDRIYLVLEELNLFPETVTATTKVLFLNFGDTKAFEAMKAVAQLRTEGVNAEMYPDTAKMDKQFKHAERRGIPFVVKEIEDSMYVLKDILSGEQISLDFESLVQKIK